jgi:thiol-disulfide isomerase/thioredoxin
MVKPFSVIVALLLLATTLAAVAHINAKNFNQRMKEAPFLLLYIYSSSCNYCKEFTPIFEKLEKNPQLKQLGVTLAKMDGPAYQ